MISGPNVSLMERDSECRNSSSSSHSVTTHYSQTLAGLKRLIMGWMSWGEEIIIMFLFSHFIPLLAISLHIYPCTNTTSLSTVFIQHMLSQYEEPQRFVFMFLVSDNVSNDVRNSWAQHQGQWHSKLTESCRPYLQQQLYRGQINTACRNGPNISMITSVLLPTNAGSLCIERDAFYRGTV